MAKKIKRQAKVITLRARANHQFLEQAQGASVAGATLPNGYTVPKAPKGKSWIVRRRSLYLLPVKTKLSKLPK